MLAATIDDPWRAIAWSEYGVTFTVDGRKTAWGWGMAEIRVSVKMFGVTNPFIVLRITVDGRAIGGDVFGNVEMDCWRTMEDVIQKYAPGIITGAPERKYIPLHDKNGNIVPEPGHG